MRLLPFKRFELNLPDPPAILAARLAACTAPDTWLSKFTGGSPLLSAPDGSLFAGEVSESGFRVRRIISYGNPYRPRLYGQILRTDEGTRVEVSMRFPETRGALAIMGLASVFGIIALVAVFSSGLRSWPFALIPWAMMLFYWIMIQGSFWLDAPASRRELTQILSEP
jgi:hypothetical protein